jgi:Flp pilus assembly protein TadB
MRRALLAAVAALPLALVFATPAYADGPALAVSSLRTTPGHVEFYLAARDLPFGSDFGRAQVSVSVNGAPLIAHTTAVGSDAAAPKRATMLVLDVSGSMRGARLDSAKAAAQRYVDGLPADVRVGLVEVSTHATVAAAPTTNHRAVRDLVENMRAGGETALYDGIAAGVRALKAWPDDRRVVLLTDGKDSSSSSTLANAIAVARGGGVAVDTVGFLTSKSAQAVLSEVAQGAGGRSYTASDDATLADAFQSAAGWFGTQLDVSADVPVALSGASSRLQITAKVGATSVVTSEPVTFDIDPNAPVTQQSIAGPRSPRVAYIAIGSVIFLAFLLFGLVLFAPLIDYARHRRRVSQVDRYVAAAGDESAGRSLKQAALAATEQMVRSRGMESRIALKLDQAGMRLRPHEWVLLRVIITVVLAFLLSLLINIPIGALAALLIGIGGTWIYQRVRIDGRKRAFAQGLPDALQLIIGSLRSGFSLPQAVAAMAAEVGDPLAAEFNRAIAETRLGVDLEHALEQMAKRVGSVDLSWVVVAVKVQREVGGNLAEVLTRTVETMREREAIRGEVRSLAAEGKLSAYILVGLPIIIGLYMAVVRRDYLRPLYTQPLGIVMLLVGVALLIAGAFWMSRAVKVEV